MARNCLYFLVGLIALFRSTSSTNILCTCPEKWADIRNCSDAQPSPVNNSSASNGTTESTVALTPITTITNQSIKSVTIIPTTTIASTTTMKSASDSVSHTCCKLNGTLRCQNSQAKQFKQACPQELGCPSTIEGIHCKQEIKNGSPTCNQCSKDSYWDINLMGGEGNKCRTYCQGMFGLSLHWYTPKESTTDYTAGTCGPDYGKTFYLIVILPPVLTVLLIVVIVVVVCVVRKRKAGRPPIDTETHPLNTLPTKEAVDGVEKRNKPDTGLQRKMSKPNSYITKADGIIGQGEHVQSIAEDDEYSEAEGYENEATITNIQRSRTQQPHNQREKREPFDQMESENNATEEVYENTQQKAPNQLSRPDSFEDSYENEEFRGQTVSNNQVEYRPNQANINHPTSEISYTPMTEIQQALQTEEDDYTPPSDGGRSDSSQHSANNSDFLKKLQRLKTVLPKPMHQAKEPLKEYDYAANTSVPNIPHGMSPNVNRNSEQLYTGENQRAIYADNDAEGLAVQPPEQQPAETVEEPIYQNYTFDNDEQVYENN